MDDKFLDYISYYLRDFNFSKKEIIEIKENLNINREYNEKLKFIIKKINNSTILKNKICLKCGLFINFNYLDYKINIFSEKESFLLLENINNFLCKKQDFNIKLKNIYQIIFLFGSIFYLLIYFYNIKNTVIRKIIFILIFFFIFIINILIYKYCSCSYHDLEESKQSFFKAIYYYIFNINFTINKNYFSYRFSNKLKKIIYFNLF